MFKKLVIGALATGIALTAGIGAASADTVKPKPVSSSNKAVCTFYEYSNGKYKRTVTNPGGKYASSFTEDVCGGTIIWYLKSIQGGVGIYEGHMK